MDTQKGRSTEDINGRNCPLRFRGKKARTNEIEERIAILKNL